MLTAFEQEQEKKKDQQEAYDRITAPYHVRTDYFRDHVKVEGFHEQRDVKNFFGCDRLLKMDSRFGTIQMGYDPRKGQSFLFANIKTSIYDTAASAHQKQIKESSMMKEQKTGNQNLLYNARRRQDSATILYKYENKPWSYASLSPYLARINSGALNKVMPFLSSASEQERRRGIRSTQRENMGKIQGLINEGKFGEVEEVRHEQLQLSTELEQMNSMIYRKNTQSRSFFRKVNMAFDVQKHEMFAYYRIQIARRRLESTAEIAGDGENNNNNNNE